MPKLLRQRPSSLRRGVAGRFAVVLGLAALVASPLLPVPSAGAAGCAAGWTAVGDTECELVVTASGDITMPDGVPAFDVMVVGGGGGGGGGTIKSDDPLCVASQGCPSSNFSWAGGGGAGGQTVCEGMALSGTVSVTIGAGGLGAVAATLPSVTPAGGDGGSTTVDSCTAAGGKGGGSSVSTLGPVCDGCTNKDRVNGSGGDSGNGVPGIVGNAAYYIQYGGGGASNATVGSAGVFPAEGQRGGSPTKPTGACFTGTTASWAGGGSGGGAGGATNTYSFVFNPSTGQLQQYRSGSYSQDGFLRASEPAVAGPANTGNGGGGGQQMPYYQYSSGEIYPSSAYGGADGGSGVVVIRYTLAGGPTLLSASGRKTGDSQGNYDVTIEGTNLVCGPKITIGGQECVPYPPGIPGYESTSTKIVCLLPGGTGLADVEVVTPAGTASVPDGFCYGFPGTPECTPDNGGGGGDNGGGGDGTSTDESGDGEVTLTGGAAANRTSLPATGADTLLALGGTASLVLGSSAIAVGSRRRRSTNR